MFIIHFDRKHKQTLCEDKIYDKAANAKRAQKQNKAKLKQPKKQTSKSEMNGDSAVNGSSHSSRFSPQWFITKTSNTENMIHYRHQTQRLTCSALLSSRNALFCVQLLVAY